MPLVDFLAGVIMLLFGVLNYLLFCSVFAVLAAIFAGIAVACFGFAAFQKLRTIRHAQH